MDPCPPSQFFAEITQTLIDGVCDASRDLRALHSMMADGKPSPFGALRSISELAAELDIRMERKSEPVAAGEEANAESMFLGQLKVLRQRNNGSCGFYTILNSIQVRSLTNLWRP